MSHCRPGRWALVARDGIAKISRTRSPINIANESDLEDFIQGDAHQHIVKPAALQTKDAKIVLWHRQNPSVDNATSSRFDGRRSRLPSQSARRREVGSSARPPKGFLPLSQINRSSGGSGYSYVRNSPSSERTLGPISVVNRLQPEAMSYASFRRTGQLLIA